MILVAAVALAAAVAALLLGRAATGSAPPEPAQPVPPAAAGAAGVRPRLRYCCALLVAVTALLVLGLTAGAVVGGGLAALVIRAGRARSGHRIGVEALPLFTDLLAGCLRSGAAMPDALAAAGCAGDPPLRAAVAGVAAELRAGVPADQAWAEWLADPSLGPIARTTVRADRSGAAVADELSRTAARLRARMRADAQRRVQRAAVWVVVPLGLCFLPAFLLVAVVPLVIGLLPHLS